MASTIGIKIANGEFYSIVEENSPVKKRLILTTVHDSQKSVQIDLYKSYTKSMADALYIGSLVVENITAKPKGGPSIELIIASSAEGEISADAVDLDTKAEHHHLSVSLKSLDEDSRDYEIPDFELDQDEAPPGDLYDQASEVKKRKSRGGFPWLVIAVVALLILIAAGILAWFFLFRGNGAGTRSSRKTGTTAAAPAAERGEVPVIAALPAVDPAVEPPRPAAGSPASAAPAADPAAEPPRPAAGSPAAAAPAAAPPAEPVRSA
ncbi:MAG: Hsp70 family protein, partial [Treponema sp.]|nr:Hsp70 family protein [Treponema sp.]